MVVRAERKKQTRAQKDNKRKAKFAEKRQWGMLMFKDGGNNGFRLAFRHGWEVHHVVVRQRRKSQYPTLSLLTV